MILNTEQQQRFIYFLTLGLLILLGIPLIVFISLHYDLTQPINIILITIVLGLSFFFLHQTLIKWILKVSQKNQVKQQDIKFAAFLIYTKSSGTDFIVTKEIHPDQIGFHLNYRTNSIKYIHIRKRALFTILAIQEMTNVILSAETRKSLQDEWTNHLEDNLNFEEAFILWRKEMNEVSPLVKKNLKNIKRLTKVLTNSPDIKTVNKILNSVEIQKNHQ